MIFFLRSDEMIKRLFICLAVLMALPVMAQAGIEEHITETESGFFYTIQKGDTLWDLSQEFADSPWQWPNLWHYNPDIKNPHLIYPGQKIRIYKKSWEDREKPEPVAEKAPEPQKYRIYSAIDALGFIRKDPVTPWGKMVKAKEDKQLISTGDKVYLQPAETGKLPKGTRYFLYRTSDPVNDPQTEEYIGIQHLITGVVEITQKKENFAVGRIHSAFRNIGTNDLLMPFQHRSERIEITDPVPGLSGKIIKAENDVVLIDELSTAFIDKGSQDGIEVGQKYNIYYDEFAEAGTLADEKTKLTPENVGELMVLRTEPTTSTVLITNSRQPVEPGMPVVSK